MSNYLALLEEKIHQLPPNLIVEVDSFVNELLQKYRSTAKNTPEQSVNFENEPFIGMWKDREDMIDSSAWVRKHRSSEWG